MSVQLFSVNLDVVLRARSPRKGEERLSPIKALGAKRGRAAPHEQELRSEWQASRQYTVQRESDGLRSSQFNVFLFKKVHRRQSGVMVPPMRSLKRKKPTRRHLTPTTN